SRRLSPGPAPHLYSTHLLYTGFSLAGVDSAAAAPEAPRRPRLFQTILAVMAVILVSSLVALFIVGKLLGDLNATDSLYPHHSDWVARLQETIQMFKSHEENSSTWGTEIQMLSCRVDSVSSQIQVLRGHLENASADIQRVKDVLEDASTLSFQTQMLRSSVEGAGADLRKLKGDLEKANASNSQTHSFLKSSLENASLGLHMLSRGLKMANAQAQWGSLQNASALNSQMQTFLRGSLDNTSAEIQLLKGHSNWAGDEIHLLKRDLETVTAQTQVTSNSLKQTDAQIQLLKTELENASALDPKIEVLGVYVKNASREIQTLKQGMKTAADLGSKIQRLESSLQKASADIWQLKVDLENTKTLTMKIQEEQSRLEAVRVALGSQEQLQRTQNQLLQLILQGWHSYGGSVYYFSYVKKSWHEAEQFCVSQGAHLASVTSEEEQAFLVKFTSTSHHWIGLTDSGKEGSWRWVDGTPFNAAQSRAFWGRNQPDNWQSWDGQTEDCVHIEEKWNDIRCDTPYNWVCKKTITGWSACQRK
uniref:C-type lectin domain family 4 member F n=1 Tax=Neovison vison TaxID=452646 RepID=A0A8C7ABA1_NEOVI